MNKLLTISLLLISSWGFAENAIYFNTHFAVKSFRLRLF